MTDFKFTISRSAISAAFRITEGQDLVTDSDDTEMTRIAGDLDAALRRAEELREFEEVFDTDNQDTTTYLAKLRMDGHRTAMIGVLTELRSSAYGKWCGMSNKILVTVKSIAGTGEKIRQGKWKSMTGKAIFFSSSNSSGDVTRRPQPETSIGDVEKMTCVECKNSYPSTKHHFYFVRNKPRKQCKGCYKRLRQEYREKPIDEMTLGEDETCDIRTLPTGTTNGIQDTLRQLFATEAEQIRAVTQAESHLAETLAKIAAVLGSR